MYPDKLENSVENSIINVKERYNTLCNTGVVKNGITYKIDNDDIAMLYHQTSSNLTSLSSNDCVCFAICYGNTGFLSNENNIQRVRIDNISSERLLNLGGNITLDENVRYVINNPTIDLNITSTASNDYVSDYEIDIQMGETQIDVNFINIRWLGVQPSFEPNKRYLIYIDGNVGVSTEL